MTERVPRCPEFSSTYHGGCRCTFCTADATRRMKLYRMRVEARKRGVMDDRVMIDATATRKLLIRAVELHGPVRNEIARMAGVRRDTVNRIYLGRRKRVLLGTARAIARALAEVDEVRPISGHRSARVPVKRSRQQVWSLLAQGWSTGHLQDILRNNTDMNGGFLASLTAGKFATLYAAHADAVDWLARTIGPRTGPSQRVAGIAAAHGYLPLKHYTPQGDLDESTLTSEQRAARAERSSSAA